MPCPTLDVCDGRWLGAALAANASLFAILSSLREEWAYGLAPGGLTNAYNGHSFWGGSYSSFTALPCSRSHGGLIAQAPPHTDAV